MPFLPGLLIILASQRMGAGAMLDEIDSLKPPFDISRAHEKAYLAQYEKKARRHRKNPAACDRKRDALILKLYKTAPENPRVPELLRQRWVDLVSSDQSKRGRERVTQEIDSIIAQKPPEPVLEKANFYRISLQFYDAEPSLNRAKIASQFADRFPRYDDSATLLVEAASASTDDVKRTLLQRVVNEYPKHEGIAMVKGALFRLDAVGKPLKLSFDDFLTHTRFDIESLKGKVVLVNFWATWCGPCREEFPLVKELYREYQPKGLEVVGISLDLSADDLKRFLKEEVLPWPQYFQGKRFESEFSASWGVDAIPENFLIDRDGHFVGAYDVRQPDFKKALEKQLNLSRNL